MGFIIRINSKFIKYYKNQPADVTFARITEEPMNIIEKNKKLAYNEGILSIVTNVLLFGLKYWAGIVTGSVAIVADAWHTLSDSLSSLVVIVGAKVASKPPDKEHPFGHGRAELVASILIAALLGFVAYEFISDSVAKLNNHEEAIFGTLAILVTIISIIIKEAMAQYAFWAARKSGSSSLRADAFHHRTDAISSAIILVGIFVGRYYWWVDGVLGILVAFMILYAAYEILAESISRLLGEAPDAKLIKNLNECAEKVTKLDLMIHHVHVHAYGYHKELTCHIYLPKTMTVEQAHDLSDNLENQIKLDLDIIATIHVEPHPKS